MPNKIQNSKLKMQNNNSKFKKIIPPKAGYQSFALCALRFDFRGGFTMIEMTITIFIIAIIATIVLANFSGFGENVAMQRSAQEFALLIRQAQNMSLSVRQIETSAGRIVPPAIGVYLNVSLPESYILFADLDNNKRYDPSIDAKIGNDIFFEKRVKIDSLLDQNSIPQTVINIVFAAPEASVTIYNQDNPIGEQAIINLITTSGVYKKKIGVRTSGQISIEN